MAIYTTLKAIEQGRHGVFESSNLKSTDVGNLYDVLVRDEADKEIDVDNGVPVVVGKYTHNAGGLQERFGKIAAVTDKIAVTGAPALIKVAFTKAQNSILNYFNPAGNPVKCYEVLPEDIFGVALHQFTDASVANVKEDAFVVVDGNGMYVAQEAEPDASANGFIGVVHSIAYDQLDNFTLVRIALRAERTACLIRTKGGKTQ